MKPWPVLLFIVTGFSLLLGAEPDLEKEVANCVERIKTISGVSEEVMWSLPGRDEPPISDLEGYGMAAIPLLAPYLSDTTPTKAARLHGSRRTRTATVNEYIGYVINRIADHYFYLPKDHDSVDILGDEPLVDARKIKAFQVQIHDWYKRNKDKSLAERKLDDLNDAFHYNRFASYKWLKESKLKEGRSPLEHQIETLLKNEGRSLAQSEMVACAEALAAIGDVRSTDVVRKVCDHLSLTGYSTIPNLFGAHRSLAALGQKQEALTRLNELKQKHLKEMEVRDPGTQKEFLQRLDGAEKW